MSELGLREQTNTIDSALVCGLSFRKVAIIIGVVMIILVAFVIVCSIELYNKNSTGLTQ